MGISLTQRRSSVLELMGPRLQPRLQKAGSSWHRAGAVGQEEESRRAGQVLLSCRTVGQV